MSQYKDQMNQIIKKNSSRMQKYCSFNNMNHLRSKRLEVYFIPRCHIHVKSQSDSKHNYHKKYFLYTYREKNLFETRMELSSSYHGVWENIKDSTNRGVCTHVWIPIIFYKLIFFFRSHT